MTIATNALISETDYSAIEDALQASEKGRRFLRAYTDRNRSLESRRLLRSISRLHRAALGTPGLNSEICRDLASVLKSVAKHRQAAAQVGDAAVRSGLLIGSLEEVEACLMALIESIEERAFESLRDGMPGLSLDLPGNLSSRGRAGGLSSEPASFFTAGPR